MLSAKLLNIRRRKNMNLSPEMTVAAISLSIMGVAFLNMWFGLKAQAEDREEKREKSE